MKSNMANREDFDLLAMPLVENLCRTALWVVDSESEARTLVQESVVRAYYAWRDGLLGADSRVGLFRILSNVLTDRDRSFSARSDAMNDGDKTGGQPLQARLIDQRPPEDSARNPFCTVSGEDLRRAIQQLPGDLRLTVVLSLAEGFSYQEIADITCIQVEGARARLHQGRRLLQRELLGYAACEGNNSLTASRVRRSQMG